MYHKSSISSLKSTAEKMIPRIDACLAAMAIGLGAFRQFHPLDAFLEKDLREKRRRSSGRSGGLG